MDELEERAEPAPNPTLVRREGLRLEAPGGERPVDRAGRKLARLHGDVDAAREDRVHERDRVADGEEAVADDRRVPVREVRLGVDGGELRGAAEPLGHASAAPDHLGVERLQRPAPLAHRARVHDTADARPIARQRDPPEPAVLEDVDADVALVGRRGPPRAAEVREERHLPEVRHALATADPRGEQTGAPARVHEEPPPHGRALAVALDHRGDALRVERDRLDGRRLAHVHAELRRVLEQDRVELGARDLVGVARPGLALEEVERVLEPRLLVVERGAVLHLEPPLGERRVDAQPIEDRECGRQQRLADVEPREGLALEQEHAAAGLREEGRGRGAGGPAADDEHVVERGRGHRCGACRTARGSIGSGSGSAGAAGAASRRSCEQSRPTTGDTKSRRATSAWTRSSPRIAGAASVARAATAARRRRGWRHQPPRPAATRASCALPIASAQAGGEPR